MLLEPLTVPKPYHDTSEPFQCDASEVQRHLASCSCYTCSSLCAAHLACEHYTSRWKFPLNLESIEMAALSLVLTPLPSVLTVLLPSPSLRAPAAKRRRQGCSTSLILLSALLPWRQSSPGELLSSGQPEVEEDIRSRGSPGPDDVSRNGGARKRRMQTQHHRSHDAVAALWYWSVTHTLNCVCTVSITLYEKGSSALCLVNILPKIFNVITAFSIHGSPIGCQISRYSRVKIEITRFKALGFYTRASLLQKHYQIGKEASDIVVHQPAVNWALDFSLTPV